MSTCKYLGYGCYILAISASLFVLAQLAGCTRASEGPSSQDQRPNVILIMTDDQGYGDVGAHGNEVIETPHIDELFGESVRLTDYHVDPTCSPTRSALLTGRYSTKTGVWHTIAGRSLLTRDEVTIADVFAEAGYRTGAFGKWHLGDNYPFRVQDRGFQRSVVHGGGGITQTHDVWGNDYFDDTYWVDGERRKFEGYCTTVFFDEALRFIQENRDEPFFAYIPTNVAHGPYNAPGGYVEPYLEQGLSPRLARFYGMLTHFDEQLGRLRARLKEWNLAENTILIFTSDNGTAGGGFNAGMRDRKGSQYEGGHRVPFYIRWPGGEITGGRGVDELTAHIDVLPTLADLAGVEISSEANVDGRSLAPLLRGEGDWPDRTLFVHSQRIQDPEKWRRSAVMTERWRLIDGEELYDIRADSSQETDVSEEHPEVVRQLRKEYNGWWEELSVHFDEMPRIILGSGRENPRWLTAFDWHNPESQVPWNQRQISQDPELNGFWAVEIAEAGTYRITLRQRPDGVYHPIDGSTARLRIGSVDRTQSIPAGASAVSFEVDLESGPAKLRTAFMEEGREIRGAYYAHVEPIQ